MDCSIVQARAVATWSKVACMGLPVLVACFWWTKEYVSAIMSKPNKGNIRIVGHASDVGADALAVLHPSLTKLTKNNNRGGAPMLSSPTQTVGNRTGDGGHSVAAAIACTYQVLLQMSVFGPKEGQSRCVRSRRAEREREMLMGAKPEKGRGDRVATTQTKKQLVAPRKRSGK